MKENIESDFETTTLGLQLPSDPRWVNIAQMQLNEILIDHAFCEQKAASSCISMIVQYPEKTKLVEMLTPVVTEEWGHFQRVLKEMKKRGIELTHKRKDDYVNELLKFVRKGKGHLVKLMDQLLVNAMIEARSAERFKLLAKEIADEGLKKFYWELMISEATHYRNFIDLAKEYCPEDEVMDRWRELLKLEAEIIRNMEPQGNRMH